MKYSLCSYCKSNYIVRLDLIFVWYYYLQHYLCLKHIYGSYTKLIFEPATMSYHTMSESTKYNCIFSLYKWKSVFPFLLSLVVETPC